MICQHISTYFDKNVINSLDNKLSEFIIKSVSYFDIDGNNENFYHMLVLGMLIGLSEDYEIKSNRESGFGRYDVMLLPKSKRDNAIILEFKVREPDSEKTLEDTVESALDQIIEKKYDAELLALGITQERIRHYGFAFEGKKVLIG